MDAPLDEAELEDGQGQNQHHQNDRLGRRATQIVTAETIHIDLVDKGHRVGGRLAAQHRVDGAKGVEQRIGEVGDQQEEACRGEQRESHVPEAALGRRIVDAGSFHHRARDRLQSGQEENEIDRDLLPDRGSDHDNRGVGIIKADAEIITEPGEKFGDRTPALGEHDQKDETGHRRRDRINPHQEGAIGAGTADDLVRLDRKEQGNGQRQEGHRDAEDNRETGNLEIFGIVQDVEIVVEADKGRAEAKRIFQIERQAQRLPCRPVEKDDNDRQLWQQEEQGQPFVVECGAFHVLTSCSGRVRIDPNGQKQSSGAEEKRRPRGCAIVLWRVQKCLFLGLGEAIKKRVAVFFDGSQSAVDVSFPVQEAGEFAVFDVADLNIEAHAITAGILTRLQGKLLDANFSGREAVIVAIFFSQLVSCCGDRHVTGFFVPEILDFRRRHEFEESSGCFVFFCRFAGHGEQGSATDEGLVAIFGD